MAITHERFGSKAANLAALSEVLPSINADDHLGVVGVPEFEAVPVTLFEQWRSGNVPDSDLKYLYERTRELGSKGVGAMIRSSAVLSEDGKHTTGAGVYDSVRLNPNVSFKTFVRKLEQVYLSTTSGKALSYMESLGINPADERMGVILQTIPDSLSTHVTLDSVVAGMPGLALVRTNDLRLKKVTYHEPGGFRSGLKKTKLGTAVMDRAAVAGVDRVRFTAHPDSYADIFHIVPDRRKFTIPLSAVALTKLALQLEAGEAHFKTPEERQIHKAYTQLWLFQQRPIPEHMIAQKEFIGFPDNNTDLFRVCRGVGVMNGVIGNIGKGDLTTETREVVREIQSLPIDEKYVMLFDRSYGYADLSDKLTKKITSLTEDVRSKIVVMVTGYSGYSSHARNDGAHLETMCLELGIPCVFYGDDLPSNDLIENYTYQPERMYIYSNGYEARLFVGHT